MDKDISKTIVFQFSNKFTKSTLITIKLPYLPFYSTNGYYSKLFKRTKEVAAFGFEKGLVKGNVWTETVKSNRAVITFESGLSLNMPYDVNNQDVNIIKHFLEGLKMSIVK